MIYRTDCGCVSSAPEPDRAEPWDTEEDFQAAWAAWDIRWSRKAYGHTRVCPRSKFYDPRPPGLTPDEFRGRRQALGLSQAELARELGVCRLSVCNWERGRRRVRPSVAKALGMIERGRVQEATS